MSLTRYGFAGQFLREYDAREVALSLAGYWWAGDWLFSDEGGVIGTVKRIGDESAHKNYWVGQYPAGQIGITIYGPNREAVVATLEDLVIEP